MSDDNNYDACLCSPNNLVELNEEEGSLTLSECSAEMFCTI